MIDFNPPTEFKLPYGNNTYTVKSDDEIEFPIEKSLALAHVLSSKKDDEVLIDRLNSDRIYEQINDDDNHIEFELSSGRIKFLAVHFAVNERALIAPYFRADQRPSLNTYKSKVHKRIDAIYALDRQLIDLHWWCCRARSYDIQSLSLGQIEIMEDGIINPDGLVDAVMTAWSSQQKAETLRIPTQEQVLLRSIRTETIRLRQKDIYRSANKAMTAILSYCLESPQRSQDDAKNLYDDLLCLKLADKNIKQSIIFKSMMNGDILPSGITPSKQTQMRRSLTLFRDKLNLLTTTK